VIITVLLLFGVSCGSGGSIQESKSSSSIFEATAFVWCDGVACGLGPHSVGAGTPVIVTDLAGTHTENTNSDGKVTGLGNSPGTVTFVGGSIMTTHYNGYEYLDSGGYDRTSAIATMTYPNVELIGHWY
jgi:hypothetical protein